MIAKVWIKLILKKLNLSVWIKLCNDAEENYDKEDEQMLIKLVKIRKSLWT